MEKTGIYFVPLILLVIALLLLFSKKDLFSAFVCGAKEGLSTCAELLPIFILLVTAVRMLTISGTIQIMSENIGRVSDKIHFPKELITLMIIRPLSGGAANATVSELFDTYGPDSFVGRSASVLMGASDTIIYTLSMYFGVCKISRTRYAYPAAFITMIFCAYISVYLAYNFF